jgi:hypothetical protein
MHRPPTIALACLVRIAAGAGSAHGQIPISAPSTCARPDSGYVGWETYDPAADPDAFPEWTGYDVMRRQLPDRGFVRVNGVPIPRVIGTAEHVFAERVPGAGAAYEYRIEMTVYGWEIGSCVTPVTIRSWGRLKTLHR